MDTNLIEERRKRQQAVNAKKAWLVEQGDAIGKLAQKNADWAGQARVVWEAARSENEPTVVLNLLRYQRARNKNWLEPADVFTPLKDAMEKSMSEAGGDTELALDLIRHLLVYTIRAYTFFREEAKAQEKKAS